MKTIKKFLSIFICLALMLGFVFSGCAPKEDSSSGGGDNGKEYSNEVQVVVLLGQSNAEGHTFSEYLEKTVGEAKTAEYREGYENVKISYNCSFTNNNEGTYDRVMLGQGGNESKFGPEIGIAEKISALDPVKPVYIIKFAYGGTTLAGRWRSPSSKNTGNLYTSGLDFILYQCRILEERDLYPVIKAICWMQGESDASGNSYNSYKKLEENFVNDLRKDLAFYKDPSSEIGFIDAGISDCPAWTHYEIVNRAKKELAESSNSHVYIDTIAANLKYNGEPAGSPDIFHYDSDSMIKLGHLFGDLLIANFLEV